MILFIAACVRMPPAPAKEATTLASPTSECWMWMEMLQKEIGTRELLEQTALLAQIAEPKTRQCLEAHLEAKSPNKVVLP